MAFQVTCARCGETVEKRTRLNNKKAVWRYCSRHCAGKARANNEPPPLCRHCGERPVNKIHRTRSKYCSRGCQAKALSGPHKGTYKDGATFAPDYRLKMDRVRSAVARGELSLPEGATILHPEAQEYLRAFDEAHSAAASYAERSGWPAGLHWRQVQILNILAAAGVPLTNRQLREACNLASDANLWSYATQLSRRDLVVRVRNPVRRRGVATHAYTLGTAALAILEARCHDQAAKVEQVG